MERVQRTCHVARMADSDETPKPWRRPPSVHRPHMTYRFVILGAMLMKRGLPGKVMEQKQRQQQQQSDLNTFKLCG